MTDETLKPIFVFHLWPSELKIKSTFHTGVWMMDDFVNSDRFEPKRCGISCTYHWESYSKITFEFLYVSKMILVELAISKGPGTRRVSRFYSKWDESTGFTLKFEESIRFENSDNEVQFVLKGFEVLQEQPRLSMVNEALNRARLEGGEPKCDVVICTEDGAEERAHRLVLSSCSEVFLKMFTSDWKESNEKRVVLKNISSKVLIRFIEFIYTETVTDWANYEVDLLAFSDCYMVQRLKEECLQRLRIACGARPLSVLQQIPPNLPVIMPIRRHLYQIVMRRYYKIRETKEWNEFKAKQPELAEVIEEAVVWRNFGPR